MRAVKNKILIGLNLLVLLYILYRLIAGTHKWYKDWSWGGPPTGSYKFETYFLLAVALSILLPIIMAIWLKKPVWLTQTLAILLVAFYWKSDLIQRTLFYYSPLSTYRNIQLSIDIIDNKEDLVNDFIALLEQEMVTNNADLPHENITFTKNSVYILGRPYPGYKDSIKIINGEPVLKNFTVEVRDTLFFMNLPRTLAAGLQNSGIRILEIDNNKILSCQIFGKSSGDYHNPVRLIYYPYGSEKEKYFPHNTNFYKPYCADKTYHYGDKWLIHIGGNCSG